MEYFLVLDASPLFLSNEGRNRWTISEISGFYGIFQKFPGDLPKQMYPSHANSKTKKV